jgi:hypothetical protein
MYCLSVPVSSLWLFGLLLRMHLLGTAECVGTCCVFVSLYIYAARNDILKRILRRAVHRAGIASTLEPPLRRLPGFATVLYYVIRIWISAALAVTTLACH